jgi:hypothetical protein
MANVAAAGTGHSGTFGIGRVIARTFGVTGQNFIAFFLLALIARLPLLPLQLLEISKAQPGLTSQQAMALAFTPASILTGLAGLLLALIMSFVLQAALVHGTIVSLNGRKASLADCLGTGLRVFFPVVGISFLVSWGAILGFLLFVVPGIMLIVRWVVAVPVRVAEGPGILSAMGRSAELTHGHRWAIFGTMFLFVLMLFGLELLLLPLAAVASLSPAIQGHTLLLVNLGLSTLVSALGSMVGAVLVASIYYELRTIKEGIGPEQLAAVFS